MLIRWMHKFYNECQAQTNKIQQLEVEQILWYFDML